MRPPLGTYVDHRGRQREVLSHPGPDGTALVIDRDVRSRSDCRLVAHLAPDEPTENAAIVSTLYLADEDARGRCRLVRARELDEARDGARGGESPLAAGGARAAGNRCTNPRPGARTRAGTDPRAGESEGLPPGRIGADRTLVAHGSSFRLGLVWGAMSIPELRWLEIRAPRDVDARSQTVSLRHVVARLEAYEPACSLTEAALRGLAERKELSVTTLRLELGRVRESPIVLNRRLREAVVAAVSSGRLSMSEIAIRCGRIKRDGNGNESGETSWLARRLGLLAESGGSCPTPWVHSAVLAVIARQGLGVAPREVEL